VQLGRLARKVLQESPVPLGHRVRLEPPVRLVRKVHLGSRELPDLRVRKALLV
jgi:hypothetical protein